MYVFIFEITHSFKCYWSWKFLLLWLAYTSSIFMLHDHTNSFFLSLFSALSWFFFLIILSVSSEFLAYTIMIDHHISCLRRTLESALSVHSFFLHPFVRHCRQSLPPGCRGARAVRCRGQDLPEGDSLGNGLCEARLCFLANIWWLSQGSRGRNGSPSLTHSILWDFNQITICFEP